MTAELDPGKSIAGPRAAIAWATEVLKEAKVPTPEVDSALLAAHCAGLSTGDLNKAILLDKDVWGPQVSACFVDLISRRAQRIPLQHLTGTAPFRFLELAVGPGVFVPRPETELVAQVAIDAARKVDPGGGGPVVVDLCTGSGAIAISVLTELLGASVYGVELDGGAYEWAARNVAAHPGRDGRLVELIRGDARTALPQLDGTVDVVVSNPPYVPPGHIPVDVEVARHDPEIALYGLGSDGLEVPRGITVSAARLLRPGGLYVMEHAEAQSAQARDMVDSTGYFEPAHTKPDLTGRDRMVVARRSERPFSGAQLSRAQASVAQSSGDATEFDQQNAVFQRKDQ